MSWYPLVTRQRHEPPERQYWKDRRAAGQVPLGSDKASLVLMRGLALFDLDNTLADRAAAFRQWSEAFVSEQRLGHSAVAALIEADDDGQATRPDFFRAVKQRFDLQASIESLTTDYRTRYPYRYYRSEPDTLAGLRRLREVGWKVAVVTNGPPSQEEKIRLTGLEGVVDAWCVSEMVGASKPEPWIFEEAARRCGAPLTGWMVGDSPEADIAGGIAVGLRTVWLTRGRAWRESSYWPDAAVPTIGDAIQIILADRG
jgi:HAD superfamily hydrolase (TIGR01549 family)